MFVSEPMRKNTFRTFAAQTRPMIESRELPNRSDLIDYLPRPLGYEPEGYFSKISREVAFGHILL